MCECVISVGVEVTVSEYEIGGVPASYLKAGKMGFPGGCLENFFTGPIGLGPKGGLLWQQCQEHLLS